MNVSRRHLTTNHKFPLWLNITTLSVAWRSLLFAPAWPSKNNVLLILQIDDSVLKGTTTHSYGLITLGLATHVQHYLVIVKVLDPYEWTDSVSCGNCTLSPVIWHDVNKSSDISAKTSMLSDPH